MLAWASSLSSKYTFTVVVITVFSAQVLVASAIRGFQVSWATLECERRQ
jgi:hypothetical protein